MCAMVAQFMVRSVDSIGGAGSTSTVTADTTGELLFGGITTVATSSFGALNTSSLHATEVNRVSPIPSAITILGLLAHIDNSGGASRQSVTVRKNYAASALSVSVAAGAAMQIAENYASALTFALGDTFDLLFQSGGSPSFCSGVGIVIQA
jgi:hypothetical protein